MLIRKKRKILLLVETSTGYGRDILTGISKYAKDNTNWCFEVESRGMTEYYPMLPYWKGDGIISRSGTAEMLQMIDGIGCPYMELLYYPKIPIRCNPVKVARMAIDYFQSLGFANLGFFSYGNDPWITARRDTFAQECHTFGFSCNVFKPNIAEDTSKLREPHWHYDYEAPLREWLSTLTGPIAILCPNDYQAACLLNHCRDYQIDVPNTVSILGINNDVQFCGIQTPTLSSLDPGAWRIGYEAARLLEQKMNGIEPTETSIDIDPLCVVSRQSTELLVIDDPLVAKAIRFVRENATQGIRVSDIVKENFLTERTLQRQFKRILGHGPEKEILRIKMDRAVELLLNTSHPLRRIAELTGFSSESYFVQTFRRIKGMSPGQFRLQEKIRNLDLTPPL